MNDDRQSFSWGAALFVAILLLFFVSPTPFRDFSSIRLTDLEASNPLVQGAFLLAVGLAVTYVLLTRPSLVPSLLRPAAMLLLVWAALSALQSYEPALSLRRHAMATIVVALAAAAVTLPGSLTQLSRLLAGVSLATLGLCYFGVAALPAVAIHHTADVLEPHLEGLWRGVFQHKNVASPMMVVFLFIGAFVAKVTSRKLGWAIMALAIVFLVGAGGKTALALALPILLLSEWVLRLGSAWRRAFVSLALLGVLNLVTVGSVVIEPVQKFNEAVMPDPSFTGRTDIWSYGFERIKQRPLTGYGFATFWRTPTVISPENPDFDDASPHGKVPAWLKLVSHSHNAYLDATLTMGVPGLLLLVLWLVVVPMTDTNRIVANNGNRHLTLLLFRIWLLGIYLSSLEAIVFDRANPVWFMTLFAVFGLGVMARYRVRADAGEATAAIDEEEESLEAPGGRLPTTAVAEVDEPEPLVCSGDEIVISRI